MAIFPAHGPVPDRGNLSRALLFAVFMLAVLVLVPAAPRPEVLSGPFVRNQQALPSLPDQAALRGRLTENLGKMPVAFTANHGQYDSRVRFAIESSDKTVYFTNDGVTFVLTQTAVEPAEGPAAASQRWTVKLDFVGANAGAEPIAEAATGGIVGYFKGPQEQWKSGIPQYSRVVYAELWPGIDLVYSGTYQRLKYEFIVHPGADPSRIRMAYRGGDVALTPAGALGVTTPLGGFQDDVPVSFQDGQEVATAFALDAAAGTFGFALGAYDTTRTLVIDPAIFLYATFIGGSGHDQANGIAIDADNNIYVVGTTASTEATFPETVGPDLTYNSAPGAFNEDDAFVAKLNAAGTALVYAGYIGGNSPDTGHAIALDSARNAYIVGSTASLAATFPVTQGPDLTDNGFGEGFIAKVNAAGTSLVYAGFIGGNQPDTAESVAVDADGNAYVAGTTNSPANSFPDGSGLAALPGPDHVNTGFSGDAYIVKVKPDGTGFLTATFAGGSSSEKGSSLALDSQRRAYLVGTTDSNDTFSGVGAFSTWLPTRPGGQLDIYVARLNAAGTAFDYAGYIGGSGASMGADFGGVVAVDADGNAYVSGWTFGDQTTFPDGDGFGALPGADQTLNSFGPGDAFVVKVNNTGTALVYATYIGGAGSDEGHGITVDGTGAAYLYGITTSSQFSFPDGDGFGTITGADMTLNGSQNNFVVSLSPGGTLMTSATYIDGSIFLNIERGGIVLDGAGNTYVAGGTSSTQTTFPDGDGPGAVPGLDQTANGQSDAYVVKISPNTPTEDPCPGPATINLITGANGYVYCGAGFAVVTGPPLRAPGPLPDTVTALFSWDTPNQVFDFWFRGFPDGFQTLANVAAGGYYFFQSTANTGSIPNTGGSTTLPAAGTTSIDTVAGANGRIWGGTNHGTATLGTYASLNGVTAVFEWDNPGQLFRFWFRGFPDGFQTLTPGLQRGGHYFFQAPNGLSVLMD